MDDGGSRMRRQELACPQVVLGGAHRHQRRPSRGGMQRVEVEIDSLDHILGVPVAQHRLIEISIECLEVQGRQHCLGGTLQVDRDFVRHVGERNTLGARR